MKSIFFIINFHLFPYNALCQQLRFQAFLMQIDWALIEPIRSFLTSQGSRCDSETSWLFDDKTQNNLMDTLITSQKIKICARSKVGQAEPSWLFADSANVWQDRTGQRQNSEGQDGAGWGHESPLSSALVPLIFWKIALEFQHCLFVQLVSVLLFGLTI